jgi:hypothetical protein
VVSGGERLDRLIAASPSEQSWRALCRALGRARRGTIDDVGERIAGWPDALREAPWSWLSRALAGGDVPALRLARIAVVQSRRVEDAAIERLVASANVGGLMNLVLDDNLLGPRGARALAASPHLGELVLLLLGSNRIGDEGAQALAEARGLGSLASLDVSHDQIGDEGAAAIVGGRGLPILRNLYLEENRITDAGARRIASMPALSRYEQLMLDDNPIGEAGHAALAASPHRSPALRLAWIGAGSLRPREPVQGP